MTKPHTAERLATVPGTHQYTVEIVDLLLHDRGMLAEVVQRIIADVEARTLSQGLRLDDAYALAEAEVRNVWPALADAVLIMVNLSNAGLLRR